MIGLPSGMSLHTASRFAIAGVLATGAHVATAMTAIVAFRLTQVVANEIAFGLATCVSYLLQTCWSFSSRVSARSLCRYLLVTVLGFALTALIAETAELAGWSYWIGILLVILIIPPITFVLHSTWTYRAPPS